ncbi:MAG: sigma-54-dependent Fis family transcriptional regulator [Deltaproteobacteria bacterium]|nr:sigma-54-dependent Fis family transcriptional regulator [Deltaproteobacteria bacterium]
MRLLVIDDEEAMRHMLSIILKKEGYEVHVSPDALHALSAIEAAGGGDFDFILCDIKMPRMDGLEFLKALKDRGLQYTVIMMSAYGTLDTAIDCMKLGAYDYISKPFKTDEIILTLKKAEERERLKRENKRLKEETCAEYDIRRIVTKDKAMLEVLKLVNKVSGYDTPVLIIGESGTGKELIARAIHDSGDRKNGPFVAVNCGAIPAALLESELFGHVKGAFTDAHRNKAGLFQEADGGTIFLDEVGELPLPLQVKFLRVLQEGEVRKVGDTKSVKIATRVVAATVKDLREEIKKGAFREDLFYRLDVVEVNLPPLRDRGDDIPGLAAHFIEKYSKKFGKPVKTLPEDVLKTLKGYSWPGNVRELENAIERAIILEETGVIRKESLPMAMKETGGVCAILPSSSDLSIKRASEAIEKALISKALAKTGNNKTKAAELLDISFRALLYKIKDYGL